MIRSLPRIWAGLRDMLGSEDLILPTWRAMMAEGRLEKHPLGPGEALFELDDHDPVALWVNAVDAQRGLQVFK